MASFFFFRDKIFQVQSAHMMKFKVVLNEVFLRYSLIDLYGTECDTAGTVVCSLALASSSAAKSITGIFFFFADFLIDLN